MKWQQSELLKTERYLYFIILGKYSIINFLNIFLLFPLFSLSGILITNVLISNS